MVSITLDVDEALFWRIYCKAVEHGVSVPEEIVAQLSAGHIEHVPDAEARLAEAREIRGQARDEAS